MGETKVQRRRRSRIRKKQQTFSYREKYRIEIDLKTVQSNYDILIDLCRKIGAENTTTTYENQFQTKHIFDAFLFCNMKTGIELLFLVYLIHHRASIVSTNTHTHTQSGQWTPRQSFMPLKSTDISINLFVN